MIAAMRRTAALAALALVACTQDSARPLQCAPQGASHPRAAAYSAFVEELVELGVPGAAMWVHDVDGTWGGAAGQADLSTGAPMTACHAFQAGSITKIVTATAVAMLVEEGTLSLDEPISRYLDDRLIRGVENADRATLREVMQHRSGIYNYTDATAFTLAMLDAPTRPLDSAEAVRFAAGHPATHPSGEAFRYSNTNYELLGLLVEHAAGTALGDFVEQRIAAPLGLQRLRLAVEPEPPALDEPSAYADLYEDRTLIDVSKIHVLRTSAAGGLISDLPDLQLFLDGLLGGHLVGAEMLEQMQIWSPLGPEPFGELPPEPFDGYGLGLLHSSKEGLVGHAGDTLGMSAHLYRVDPDTTVALAANATGITFGRDLDDALWEAIASGLLSP